MEHSPATSFAGNDAKPLRSLTEAIKIARRSVSGVTDLPIDAISHCERSEDGTWRVTVDVIESHARLGDNDLLAAFEVQIDPAGELLYCSRTGRYRREEQASR